MRPWACAATSAHDLPSNGHWTRPSLRPLPTAPCGESRCAFRLRRDSDRLRLARSPLPTPRSVIWMDPRLPPSHMRREHPSPPPCHIRAGTRCCNCDARRRSVQPQACDCGKRVRCTDDRRAHVGFRRRQRRQRRARANICASPRAVSRNAMHSHPPAPFPRATAVPLPLPSRAALRPHAKRRRSRPHAGTRWSMRPPSTAAPHRRAPSGCSR
jgi:hypothetical protein